MRNVLRDAICIRARAGALMHNLHKQKGTIMYVDVANRLLLLNLRAPEKVLATISTARGRCVGASTLVAMPHALDEVRVLRNLGFDVPSPTVHYTWPRRPGLEPLAAQRDTVAFLVEHPRAYCLSAMGTGKTLATLWAYDYLRQHGRVCRALVVSPLSTITRVWADHIFMHFPHLTYSIVHGTFAQRMKALAHPADIYLINHHGVALPREKRRSAQQEAVMLNTGMVKQQRLSRNRNTRELHAQFQARKDIDVVIVDELAVFRNKSTDLWNGMSALVSGRAYVWGLTGTPTPTAPTDAYAQCKLLTPSSVPRYFSDFRDMVMLQGNLAAMQKDAHTGRKVAVYNWIPRANALDVVYRAMQPSVTFAREDCVDLPPTTYTTRQAEMSREQQTAYAEMMNTLKLQFEAHQITAANAGVKALKLLQIGCGVVYDTAGGVARVCAPGRIEAVREFIEESGAKVIVFVPFTEALHYVADELAKDYTVAKIYGSVSKKARDDIFGAFQTRPDPHVLVAQATTMSHGLTLTAASTIVWYAPAPTSEAYVQANARVTRPGQTRNTLIAHIECTDYDRRAFARLRNQESLQNTLLDLFAERC